MSTDGKSYATGRTINRPMTLLPVRFPRSFFVDRPEGDEVCLSCMKRLRDPRAVDCSACEQRAVGLINALRAANGLEPIAAPPSHSTCDTRESGTR